MHRLQGSRVLSRLSHLVRRFFGSVFGRSLDQSEQIAVHEALGQPLASLFFSMRRADQRHSVEVWKRLDSDPTLAEPALLHDVGKIVSDLGSIQRSLATICAGLRIRVHGRWAAYLDHGAIGASMLEEAGASALAVDFTRFHPGPVPAGVDPETWRRLSDADNA